MSNEKKGKLRKLVIFAIVMGFCLTTIQIGAVTTTNPSSDQNIFKTPKVNTDNIIIKQKQTTPIPITCNNVQKMTLENQKYLMNTLELGVDVPIDEGPDDEISPSIALCSGENIIATYATKPGFVSSSIVASVSVDNGNTWNAVSFGSDGYEIDPSVAYTGQDNHAVLTWTLDPAEYSEKGNIVYDLPDITDTETWTGLLWNWDSYDFSDWHGFFVDGYYTDEIPTFWGVYSYIGDCNDPDVALATDCLWLFTDGTKWYGEGYGVCNLFPDWNYSRTTTSSCDQIKGNGYSVCDFYNDSTGTHNIGIMKYPLETMWDDDVDWYDWEISGGYFADYSKPYISVSNDYGYIVAETNENGNQDIICFYTSDGFSTISNAIIADSIDDETDPSVYSYGNIVQCTFVKNGNICESHSTNGGLTWSELITINDQDGTVEMGWHSSQLTKGGHVVWTDNRDNSMDIYYDNAGAPGPIMRINSISGGFGIKAIIENNGADGENIPWSIDLEGGIILVGSHKEGTISSIPSGGSETVKTGFVFGLGKATITVTAGGVTKTAEGTVLGPFVIGL